MAAPAFATSVIGYPETKPVDFSNQEIRRDLSPTAIRGFFNIADQWNLNESQLRSLLGGIASSTLHAWKSKPDGRVLDQDTMTRVSLVVGIYKALHAYFGSVADYWITNPNDGPLFGGITPIEYMIGSGVLGMYEVRRMLDAWSAGH
jgi:hypothetical protein